jgi:hypothetical protein
MATWMVRGGTFAGLFGDPYLGDTELEGGHLAPALRGVSSALARLLARRDLSALLEGGDAAMAQLRALAAAFDAAAAISTQPGSEEAAVLSALRALSGLAPGEFAVLPGGCARARCPVSMLSSLVQGRGVILTWPRDVCPHTHELRRWGARAPNATRVGCTGGRRVMAGTRSALWSCVSRTRIRGTRAMSSRAGCSRLLS